MLFYNQKQEFVGISAEGLALLGYDSIEALLGVCSDPIELFLEETGYVHRFKNFSWIDLLINTNPSEANPAKIRTRTSVLTLYANASRTYWKDQTQGYSVVLHLDGVTNVPTIAPLVVAADVTSVEPIVPTVEMAPIENLQEAQIPVALEEPTIDMPSHMVMPEIAPAEVSFELPAMESVEDPVAHFDAALSIPEEPAITTPPVIEASSGAEETFDLPDFSDVLGGLQATEPTPEPVLPTVSIETPPEPVKAPYYTPEEEAFLDELQVGLDYHFDPHVAADELGLPVDLIEEFVGDFIQQAHEFTDELFKAIHERDMTSLKNLSHKLKGVAANLRIEDAFEALRIVNTSSDPVEIEAMLKHFYVLVAKLEGKPSPAGETGAQVAPAVSISEVSIPQAIEIIPLEPKVETVEEPKSFGAFDLPSDDLYSFAMDETPTVEGPTLHYDRKAVAAQLDIEPDFFEELIQEYKNDAARSRAQLEEYISESDASKWQKVALQLKGISDNLRLSEISGELSILSQTQDVQEAQQSSQRLNALLSQL